MNSKKNTYSLKHHAYSVLMLFMLLWLTVSTPFVYADQQRQKEQAHLYNQPVEEECNNPFSSTTEEKTENGTNTLSEYLHDLYVPEHETKVIVKYFKCHPSDLYFAYHPELISPPPDA